MGNRNNNSAAYAQFKRELVDEFLPCDNKGIDPSNLSTQSLKELIRQYKSTTGLSYDVTPRSLSTYLKKSKFEQSSWFICFFVAALLIRKGKLTKDECKEFYDDNDRKSPHYWYFYSDLISNEVLPSNPDLVEEKDKILPTDNTQHPLDSIFFTPQLELIIDRPKELKEINDLSKKQRLIVIDGVLGSGKKHLCKAFHLQSISTGAYEKVFWKPVERGLTLHLLISEIEDKIDLGTGSVQTKALVFADFLKTNRLLLILDDFEEADEEPGFEFFFKNIGSSIGNAEIILIRNNKAKFSFIKSANCYQVKGFSEPEVKILLEYHDINLSSDDLKSLLEITEGLPYYIDIFIQSYKNGINSSNSVVELLLQSPDTQSWIKLICDKFSADEIKLLNVLCLYNRPFSNSDVNSFCSKLGIDSEVSSLESFSKYHIAKSLGHDKWKIMPIISAYFQNKMSINEKGRNEELLGDHILSQIENGTRNASSEQILSISYAIEYYQSSGQFVKSYEVLNDAIPAFKKYNLYKLLKKFLLIQRKANNNYSFWLDYHYSHACIVTGELIEFNSAINITIAKALILYKTKRGSRETKSFFIKTFQLYASYLGTAYSYKYALDILLTTLSFFDPFELEWHTRSHAISVLSNFYIKNGNLELGEKINENIFKETYEGNNQSKGVAFTLLGTIKIEKKDFAGALSSFEEADNLFTLCKDYRGVSWSRSYKAFCYHKLGKKKDVHEIVKSVIEINQDTGFFDKDYIKWLEYFKINLTDPLFKRFVSKELNRVNKSLKEIHLILPPEKALGQAHVINGNLLGLIAQPFPIDGYINSIGERKQPIHSEFNKTMLIQIRKNPIPAIEKIFKKKPELIFSDQEYNNIITQCLKIYLHKDEILSRFIRPHFNVIKLQEIRILLDYAHVLQNVGEQKLTKELLILIPDSHKGFNYYNILGNYYRDQNDNRNADENYKIAYRKSRSNKEKGTVLYNAANLIYMFKQKWRFKDARGYCLQSINMRSHDRNFLQFPVNTLFLLEIEMAGIDKVIDISNRIKARYSISPARLEYLIRAVRDVLKKEKLINHFKVELMVA